MLLAATQELMQKIKATEQKDMSFDMRLLHLHSVIQTTKKIASSHSKRKSVTGDVLEIKRNLKLDVAIWLLIGLVAIFPISYVTIREIRSAYSNPLGIMMGIFIIAIILWLAFKKLTFNKLRFPILLTEKDISISGKSYNWDEIENTFFVYRTMKSYFVLGFRNGDIRYFDIGPQLGFKYSDIDFAGFVEHFKGKTNRE